MEVPDLMGQVKTKVTYFSRSDIKYNILPAYLVLFVFSLYGFRVFWMSVCTLIVIITQFILLMAAYYNEKNALISDLEDHRKEAAKAQPLACLSIFGLILLDGFPFYCEWGWLGYSLNFRTYYEGGVFNSLYLIAHGLFLFFMLYCAYSNVKGVDSSHQEHMKKIEMEKKEEEKKERMRISEEKKKQEELLKKKSLIQQLGDDVVKVQYYTREFNYYSSENYNCKEEIFFNKDYTKFIFGKKIYLANQILDYKVLENTITYKNGAVSRTTVDTGNMLKRAVIGGVLTGGVGAVVGATTASRTTSSEGIVLSMTERHIEITIDDVNCPVLNLYFRENNQLLKSAERIIFIILKRNNEVTTTSQSSSIADELLKLKKLKDSGVLTEDEFEIQKKKLLG